MSEKRKKKSNKGQTVLVIVVCVIGALIMGVVIAAIAIRISGKNKLKNMTISAAPELVTEEAEELTKEEQKIWKDGWIKHDGRIYEYNDSIVTFLFMGIDKRDETVKEVEVCLIKKSFTLQRLSPTLPENRISETLTL